MSGVRAVPLNSWSEFKSEWQSILLEIRDDGCDVDDFTQNYLFRGTGCSGHQLISSFDRFLRDNGINAYDPFHLYTKSMHEYLRLGRRVRELDETYDFSRDDPDPTNNKAFKRLESYAQHNGFPTRLLDWSRSPYIGSFFAGINVSSCQTGYISIWCMEVNETKKTFRRDIDFLLEDIYDNERLSSQRGCFTRNESNLPCLDELFDPAKDRFHNDPSFPLLVRFDIPSSESEKMLMDLSYMDINFISVYPDKEGMKEFAKYKLLHFGDHV